MFLLILNELCHEKKNSARLISICFCCLDRKSLYAVSTLFLYQKFQDSSYRKVPKLSDTKNLCCNLPKIQTKRPNLSLFSQKDAIGIANSKDPDQTAPLGAV